MSDLTKSVPTRLAHLHQRYVERYEHLRSQRLQLSMERGIPASDQVALSNRTLSLPGKGDYIADLGRRRIPDAGDGLHGFAAPTGGVDRWTVLVAFRTDRRAVGVLHCPQLLPGRHFDGCDHDGCDFPYGGESRHRPDLVRRFRRPGSRDGADYPVDRLQPLRVAGNNRQADHMAGTPSTSYVPADSVRGDAGLCVPGHHHLVTETDGWVTAALIIEHRCYEK